MLLRLSRIFVLPVTAAVVIGLTACSPGAPVRGTTAATVVTAAGAGISPRATSTDGRGVLASASAGTSTFRLERRGTAIRFTASLDGGIPAENDADHNWELVDDPGRVPADAAVRLDGGSFPTQAVAALAGRAGRDVTAIEVVPGPGVRVRATPTDGWFVAAWHGEDLGEHAAAKVVLRLADGSTRTIPAAGLVR